jgi:hypothetical protein
VSIAKFGVCSEKLLASNKVQYQIEQMHIQECGMLTQYTVYAFSEEQTIMSVVQRRRRRWSLDVGEWKMS